MKPLWTKEVREDKSSARFFGRDMQGTFINHCSRINKFVAMCSGTQLVSQLLSHISQPSAFVKVTLFAWHRCMLGLWSLHDFFWFWLKGRSQAVLRRETLSNEHPPYWYKLGNGLLPMVSLGGIHNNMNLYEHIICDLHWNHQSLHNSPCLWNVKQRSSENWRQHSVFSRNIPINF